MVIIGGGDYGYFLKKADSLWNKIIFTGYLSKEQLEEFYAISTLGVIPSLHEELGYVAIEMLMHKLPFICSDARGLREVSANGTYAIMIKDWSQSNHCQLLKENIEKYLFDNKELKQLSKKGRYRYLTKYAFVNHSEIGLFYI